jgi:hypothetical protein
MAVDGLPKDAMPMDLHPRTGRVLVSSASQGLVELERAGAWRVVRQWHAGHELPAGAYGDAQYVGQGLAAVLAGQGVVLIERERVRRLDAAPDWPRRAPMRLLRRAKGGFWVAFAPLPLGEDSQGLALLWQGGRVVRTVHLRDRAVATIGRWLETSRRSILAATRAGVAEIGEDGSLRLRSNTPASSIARDALGRTIAVVGSSVARWERGRFAPVLFRLDVPGEEAFTRHGDPIDVAIGARGCWHVLYGQGVLALLDAGGRPTRILTPRDGIPRTARRLLASPESGEVLVGSAQDGVVVVRGGCRG